MAGRQLAQPLIRQPGPYFYAGDGQQLVGLDGIANSLWPWSVQQLPV
jgi:hypothetical protein